MTKPFDPVMSAVVLTLKDKVYIISGKTDSGASSKVWHQII